MENYIDAFTLTIPKIHLENYKKVATAVAAIWKEHGAIAYHEYVGDDLKLDGTTSFTTALNANDDQAIIFGWVVFKSRASRDSINFKVANDDRMSGLLAPLIDPSNLIFDAQKMVYGGFKSFI